MSRTLFHPTDIDRFDCVIDVRSPAEYAHDHIPGALNCPVLDDEERATIGTLYKQVSPFEARRLGAALVSANLAHHLRHTFHDRPPHWRPLLYCWRGGLRSQSAVTWLRLVGWDAQPLTGGYKAYRRHVIEQLRTLIPRLRLHVLCGATGSAKTRLLHILAAQGAQIIDLEGCARHKGSLLGALPGVEQPSQKQFETLLAAQLARLDLSRPVFIEGESAKIGRVALPLELVAQLRAAPVIELQATPEARLAYLLRDYAYLGDDPAQLVAQLAHLKALQGKDTVVRWQAWAMLGALAPLFSELMSLHYDPLYQRSQPRSFQQWQRRQGLPCDDLSDAALEALAAQLRGLIRAASPSVARRPV